MPNLDIELSCYLLGKTYGREGTLRAPSLHFLPIVVMTILHKRPASIYVYIQIFQVPGAITAVHGEAMLNRQSSRVVTMTSISCF